MRPKAFCTVQENPPQNKIVPTFQTKNKVLVGGLGGLPHFITFPPSYIEKEIGGKCGVNVVQNIPLKTEAKF